MALPDNIAVNLKECFKFDAKVFPVVPNLKIPPAGFNWNKPENLYGDLAAAERSGCFNKKTNIGINTGYSNLVDVDCDVKKGKDGVNNFLKICHQINHDPNTTMCIETPSGGFQYYYKNSANHPIKSVNDCLDSGIDIKAAGGYVLWSGSKLKEIKDKQEVLQSAGIYKRVNDNEPIELPEELAKFILDKQNRGDPATGKPTEDYKIKPFTDEHKVDFETCLAGLSSNCSYDVWGRRILGGRDLYLNSGWPEEYVKEKLIAWSKESSKHDWAAAENSFNGWWNTSVRQTNADCITYKTLFNDYYTELLKDAETSNEMPRVEEFDYETSSKNMDKIISKDAPKNDESDISHDEPDRQQDEVAQTTPKPEEDKLDNKVYDLIKKEFYLFIDKKYSLIAKDHWNEYRNFKHDKPPMFDGDREQLFTVKRILNRKHKRSITDKTAKNQISKFITNADAKTKMEFNFGGDEEIDSNTLNTAPTHYRTQYTGGLKKQEDFDCEILDTYLYEAVCNANQEKLNWLNDYEAWKMQNPNLPSGVFFILLSEKQGTGKGTYFNYLHALKGDMVVEVDTLDEVVGDFNSGLMRATDVCLDELNFKYLKKEGERIKHFITAATIPISVKYKDTVWIKNKINFYLASNDPSVKLTSLSDRRDVYFTVNDKHANNNKLFDPVREIIEAPAGSKKAHQLRERMGKLLHRNISKFNPRDRFLNDEHDYQKIASLTGIDKLIFEMANVGQYPTPMERGFKTILYPMHGGWISSETFKQILNHHPDFNKKYKVDPISQAAIKQTLLTHYGFEEKRKRDIRGFNAPTMEVLRDKVLERCNFTSYFKYEEVLKDLLEEYASLDDGSDI